MTGPISRMWVANGRLGLDHVVLEEHRAPDLGAKHVLVKMKAASITHIDLMMAQGAAPWQRDDKWVLGSEGAGQVQAIGDQVSLFKPGDDVIPKFFQPKLDSQGNRSKLSITYMGTLCEYVVYDEQGLVEMPSHLSYSEAATLSCTALTAFNALYGARPLEIGDTILAQGTGGVSIFTIQFALAAGAEVIATTRNCATKTKKLQKLGVAHVINRLEDFEWGETAKRLSHGGSGVRCVVEVGGQTTLQQSIKAVADGGEIVILGNLGGFGAGDGEQVNDASPYCTLRRGGFGSLNQFRRMIRAMEINDIKPIVELVFRFEDLFQALIYLELQLHFGKVVVCFD